MLDIDLELLRELQPEAVKYAAVRRFPTSVFDLSILTAERELAATLELEIRRLGGDLAEAVEYVREFQGPPLPEGRKSVSFRVVAGAPDRTLSSADIIGIRTRIIDGLNSLGYELRA